jgi:flagellar L-ring protein precursor FlgH
VNEETILDDHWAAVMKNNRTLTSLGASLGIAAASAVAFAQDADAPNSSLMAEAVANAEAQSGDGTPHALRDSSMFAIGPPEARKFQQHDLVMIIVRHSSRAESKQELDTEKDYKLDAKVSAWPEIRLEDLLQLQLYAGRAVDLPAVKIDAKKDFDGEGEYKREDDFTARLTAEVIDILPNGHLILEGRTFVKTDEEEATIRITGICRPEDVTAANSILSDQIHDLHIEKMHKGELRKSTEKGLIAQVLDTIFAF